MALLTIEARKKRFKKLGLGEYNKANILKFQKMAFSDKKWHDGIYGAQTDNALRTFYNCSLVKNFKPEEFKCNCGHCSGYPTYMKQVEIKHLQKIRDHYGRTMDITSGLRCEHENSAVGGVKNSGHLRGYAADFYIKGVTETPEQRREALKWIKELPNHEFTYGAYIVDSEGKYWASGQMGNAMHTETHRPAKKKSKYYDPDTKIGEARCNENGKLYGGKPGDQTGKEVGTGNWYNGGWLYCFRAKDETLRNKLAQAMMDTCNNANIGYNASPPNRYAAWDHAEANGHDIKHIIVKGDTTCSQAVSMCMRAVGVSKKYAQRHYDIATMTKVLPTCDEFTIYRDKKHLASARYLLPGDILLSSHHTVIVVKSPNAK